VTTPAVTALWAAAWQRLILEQLDVEERMSTVERVPAVARTLAAAGREAGRLSRGEGSLDELGLRLRTWEAAVLEALAAADHARSLRRCLDCGAGDVPTIAVGLTGSRVCSTCLREASPQPRPDGGGVQHGLRKG
jgi:hypothetical protein